MKVNCGDGYERGEHVRHRRRNSSNPYFSFRGFVSALACSTYQDLLLVLEEKIDAAGGLC